MSGPIADALLNERKEANYWRRAWQTAHTAADEHYRRAEHLQMKLDEANAQLQYLRERAASSTTFDVGDKVRTVRETRGLIGPPIPAGAEGVVTPEVFGPHEGRVCVGGFTGRGEKFIPVEDLEHVATWQQKNGGR